MAFCRNCGTQLDESAKFCPSCGAAQAEQAPAENNVTPATPEIEIPVQDFASSPAPEKASGVLNVVQLVWAIINTIACCLPLGVVALIFTVIAKDAPTAVEEAKKLKTAKICNIIGTISFAVIVLLYIALVVIVALTNTHI